MPGTEIPKKGLDIATSEGQWGFKGKNYLFVIGIDAYKHWPPLNCAVKDIEDFSKVLLKRYKFQKENVYALKNAEATEQNILIQLNEFNKIITEEDNLIVYFSGHGHYDEDTQSGFWIPVDARQGNEHEFEFLNTAIIAHKLKGIDSLHTFLIIDACFSGTMVTQLKSAPKSERYKSRKILTSGRAEVVNDGPAGGNSPFAKGILVSLEKNSDLYLRASKLIVDVTNYVENQAKQTPTNGTLFNSNDEGGDFVFHLKNSEISIERTPEPLQNVPTTNPDELVEWVMLQNEKATYKGLIEFIEKYPNSQFREKAIEAMERKEKIGYNDFKWALEISGDSIEKKKQACDVYLSNFPGAKHEAQVRSELVFLENL